MKKLFTIVSIVALSITFTSCDLWDTLMLKWMENMEERANEEYTAEMISAGEIEILYSNAYDGYVNIRQQPTTKSAIIGVLRNGNKYVEKVGVHGNWIMVKWENLVGYAHKSMLGRKPWKPFNLNITADQIEGIYGTEGCKGIYISYAIFNNGRYAQYSGNFIGSTYSYGRWKFEGNDLVLTTKQVTAEGRENGVRVGQIERLPIKVKGNRVIGIDFHEKFAIDYMDEFKAERKRLKQLIP